MWAKGGLSLENWAETRQGQQTILFLYFYSKGTELPTSYLSPFPGVSFSQHFLTRSPSPLSNPSHLQKVQIPCQSVFSQAEQALYPLTMFSPSSAPLLACLRLSWAHVSALGHNHCLGMQLHGDRLPKPWKGQGGVSSLLFGHTVPGGSFQRQLWRCYATDTHE